MKILQIIQRPQLRGAEIFASHLSTHLVRLGYEVKMVCLFDGTARLPFDGTLLNLRRPLSKRFFDIVGWKQLANIIAEFNPDIVQANAGDTLKFASLSKFIFRWDNPVVFRNANKVSDFITSWPKLVLNKFFIGNVRHVISVSELCRQDFVSTYSFDARRTTTIPIGIELTTVPQPLSTDLLPAFSRGRVVLSVGSLVPEKNHAAMIRIASRLTKTHDDLVIIIVGDGKLRNELQDQIDKGGLNQKVILAGYRSDVLSLMANARVLAMPSLIEGLPGVILEAFYCKLPVVANNVGGISEVVMDNETGWLVAKDDEDGFYHSIVQAIEDDSKTRRLKQNAFDLVTSGFSNQSIAKRFADLYQNISK